MLFWGNSCLIISPQEQSCDNRGWLMLCLIWSSKCLCCPSSCTPHHLAHHSPEADSENYYSECLVQDGIVGGREADAGGWDSPTLVPKLWTNTGATQGISSGNHMPRAREERLWIDIFYVYKLEPCTQLRKDISHMLVFNPHSQGTWHVSASTCLEECGLAKCVSAASEHICILKACTMIAQSP